MPVTEKNLVVLSWRFLTPRQRIAASGCLVFFIATSTLELIGLSASIPFVSLLIDPSYAERSRFIQIVSEQFGNLPLRELLVWLSAVVGGLILIGTMASLASTTLIEWYGVRISTYLANEMVRKTLAAPYRWFLDKQAPVLAQRFVTDPTSIGLALYPPLMEIIYNGLFLVLAVGTIMLALPTMTLLVLVALLVVAVGILTLLRPATERFAAQQRQHLLYANKIGTEAVSGIKDIKIKARESYLSNMHSRTIYTAAVARMKMNLVNRSVPSLINLVGQLGLLAVALTLFLQGSDTAQLASQLTLLVLVLGRTLPAATRLFGNVNKLMASKPAVLALTELFDEMKTFQTGAAASAQIDVPSDWREIRFDNVDFSYESSQRRALKNISLTLGRNRFYGVVGPSGAGKSTFVDLLLGLFEPSAGRILIDGKPLDGYSRQSWYRNIGYVPQSPFISNDTIRRNVAFGVEDSRIDEERVWKALELAGLSDTCAKLPQRLDTEMGDRGIRLSGGQRQRIAIARAFYDEPQLLVLDEATSALDVLTEREIQNAIAQLSGRMTVVAIAHRLTTVEMSDRLFLFEDGAITAEGTYAELLKTSSMFSQLTSHFAETTVGGAA